MGRSCGTCSAQSHSGIASYLKLADLSQHRGGPEERLLWHVGRGPERLHAVIGEIGDEGAERSGVSSAISLLRVGARPIRQLSASLG
jgi:hypothetical protein